MEEVKHIEFNLQGKQTVIHENDTHYSLGIDRTITKEEIHKFEVKTNSKFIYVTPYTKYGGAHWLSLEFEKL